MPQKNKKRDNYINGTQLIKMYQRLYDAQKIKHEGAAHKRLEELKQKQYLNRLIKFGIEKEKK